MGFFDFWCIRFCDRENTFYSRVRRSVPGPNFDSKFDLAIAVAVAVFPTTTTATTTTMTMTLIVRFFIFLDRSFHPPPHPPKMFFFLTKWQLMGDPIYFRGRKSRKTSSSRGSCITRYFLVKVPWCAPQNIYF